MPIPEFLPSIHESETITCQRCHTCQYPRNGTCIRCHAALRLHDVSLQIDTLPDPCSKDCKEHLASSIGVLLRTLRKRRGICQSQLVLQAAGCIARSNLSRAECGRTLLPLTKLLPIAKALGLKAVILRFEVATPRTARKPNGRR